MTSPSDVKRLLDEASPLPWSQDEFDLYLTDAEGEPVHWDAEGLGATWGKDANPALILHAVNRLPNYEAAVDALERIQQRMCDWQDATQKAGVYREGDPDQQMAKWVHDEAFAAVRRLRGAP